MNDSYPRDDMQQFIMDLTMIYSEVNKVNMNLFGAFASIRKHCNMIVIGLLFTRALQPAWRLDFTGWYEISEIITGDL